MQIQLRTIAAALLLIAAFCLPALAQQQPQPSNQPKEPDYVTSSGFKGKIFELKNREPREIVSIIAPLGSGFKGALISPSSSSKTITVRDFPENIATMEEAIKRLDVPAPAAVTPPPVAPQDLEMTAYILIASSQEAGTDSYPAALKDVIKQLQAALNYKSYALLSPIVQRISVGSSQIQSRGIALLPDKTASASYFLEIGSVDLASRHEPNSAIYFHNLRLTFRGMSAEDSKVIGEAFITTKLNVRDGEKVVVGTASLKDKGLILVLMVKMIK